MKYEKIIDDLIEKIRTEANYIEDYLYTYPNEGCDDEEYLKKGIHNCTHRILEYAKEIDFYVEE